jgi:hypothetical protein
MILILLFEFNLNGFFLLTDYSQIVSVFFSYMMLTLASGHLFYSQRLGDYRNYGKILDLLVLTDQNLSLFDMTKSLDKS